MKNIKTIAFQLIMISAFSLFSFSSCNNMPKEEQENVPEQKNEKNEAEAQDIDKCKENFVSFNDSDFQKGQINQIIDSSYVVDLLFRMEVDKEEVKFEYAETTPPMLGYIMPWNFYQVLNNQIKIFNKEDISFSFKVKDMIWYRIQIISLKDEKNTKILINGKELLSKDQFIPLEKKYIIGKGIKQRFWKGDIGFFRVYNYADLNKFPKKYILNIDKENLK